ncbi:MAG: hypothetical protein PVF27_07435, partial [Gemmatimonadales bacterium]
NGSPDTTVLCVADSRYRLRGSGTNYEIVQKLDAGTCTRLLELSPGDAHSWREALLFPPSLRDVGVFLVQKRLVVRPLACGGSRDCELVLLSAPRPIVLLR